MKRALGMAGNFFKWALGAVVGLCGLFVAGLVLVGAYQLVTTPPPAGESRFSAFAIAYALGFVAVVVGVGCIRLIVPRFRAAGGRILDPWSFRVLGGIYALIIMSAVIADVEDARIEFALIVLVLLIIAAMRSTFGWPKRRPPDDEGPYM